MGYSLWITPEELREAARVQVERSDTRIGVTLHYLIALGLKEHERRLNAEKK